MKIEDLLDKSEQYQVAVLKSCFLSGGQTNYRAVFDSLQIAKPSFDKYLHALEDQADSNKDLFSFQWTGDQLKLELSDQHSIHEVYYLYIRNSLKFQIINYLYQYQKFSVPQLTAELAISEASLYRRLKEINGFLKEFAIQIRNGKMTGEELQIRYFFFQLYEYLELYAAAKPTKSDLIEDRVIKIIEKKLEVTFGNYETSRIDLWIRIARKRLLLKYKIYWKLQQSMKLFLDNPVYKDLKEVVFRLLSRYSIEAEEEEVMMGFAFLVSMSVLPKVFFKEAVLNKEVSSLEKNLEIELVHYFGEKIVSTEALSETHYYLTQTYGRLYFFKGKLQWENDDQLDEKRKEQSANRKLAHGLGDKTMRQLKEKRDPENTLQAWMMDRYTDILELLEQEMPAILRVGIDLLMGELEGKQLSSLLLNHFNDQSSVRIEAFQVGTPYDLILSNSPAATYPDHQKTYILSGSVSAYDIKHVQNTIHCLLQQKRGKEKTAAISSGEV